MALYTMLPVDCKYSDIRGQLTQLVHEGYQQVNILESKAGAVRDRHYHKISSEAFFVISGSVIVTFEQDEKREMEKFVKNDFFLIKPYIKHSMSFCEDCILIALYNVPIEKGDGIKDIFASDAE